MYAMNDIRGAAKNLRAWSFLAAKQLQIEYRRNLLGVTWIFLSFALSAGGIGWLLAQLQSRSVMEHVPFVAFGFVAWNFIHTMTTESGPLFSRNRALLLQAPMERSVLVFSLVLKKFYLMLLQLLTACLLAFAVGWTPSLDALMVIPALIVLLIAAVGTTLLLAVLGVVVRDLSELLNAVMRLAFFFTPIIWSLEARFGSDDLGRNILAQIVAYNPFTYMIEILRAPLLGEPIAALTWVIAGSISTLLCILGITALQIYGRRLVFWV